MAQNDSNNAISKSRALNHDLDLLNQKMDGLYKDIYTTRPDNKNNLDSIIDDLVSASDKTNYERVIDRKEAIAKAFSMAQPNDIVLIAGKACDNYMALGDQYVPYCDLDVINSYFNNV